jgi:hypothetical protein
MIEGSLSEARRCNCGIPGVNCVNAAAINIDEFFKNSHVAAGGPEFDDVGAVVLRAIDHNAVLRCHAHIPELLPN